MTNLGPPADRREDPALTADQARPGAAPRPRWAAGRAPAAASRQAADRGAIPPGPGCYEIRFSPARLAGFEALFPAFGLLALAMGVFAPETLVARVAAIGFGGLFTVSYVILLARRTVVFRADEAGITLGPEPFTFRFFVGEFTPWATPRPGCRRRGNRSLGGRWAENPE